MRRLLALLGTTVLLSVLGGQPPAEAGLFAASLRHYSPDTGYDPSIYVHCDTHPEDTIIGIAEGVDSSHYCTDIDRVRVPSGAELWCKILFQGDGSVYLWQKKFDSTGWHGLSNTFNDGAGCTLRKD